MKPTAFAVALLGILSNVVLAQSPAPKPTPLETYASNSGTRTLVSRDVGSLDSSDATVNVTVLVLEDSGEPASQMRGVRFDLRNNSAQDQVYLDEAQLTSVKKDLADIERGIPGLKRDDSAPYRVQGTQSCWRPYPAVRILCPAYYVGPDHSALRLGAYGTEGFAFPGRRPAELSDLIDRAIEELRQP
jgi:hypothetical protein